MIPWAKSIFLSVLFLLPAMGFAGAWNKTKGSGYTQLSYTYLAYNHLLQGGEKKQDLKRKGL